MFPMNLLPLSELVKDSEYWWNSIVNSLFYSDLLTTIFTVVNWGLTNGPGDILISEVGGKIL